MSTETFEQVPIEQVQNYWDRRPRNIRHSTKPVPHWLDDWAGILNIPSAFTVSPLEQERAEAIETKQGSRP